MSQVPIFFCMVILSLIPLCSRGDVFPEMYEKQSIYDGLEF
jgi:hypothetical protein